MPSRARLKNRLEELYSKYNRPKYIHPDPLEFLHNYSDPADREIVALVASSLAYGRVVQILKSVGIVLEGMGESPARFLRDTAESAISETFSGFKHRFAEDRHLVSLLLGAKCVSRSHGSLQECFLAGWSKEFDTVFSALPHFIGELSDNGSCGHLLPDPAKGSACKRINLFLRWMVRCDEVDPGGWGRIDPSKLVIPLDTHMHRIGTVLGFTSRTDTGMKTSLEITEGFRAILSEDPVKYDFALTRLGIRKDADIRELLEE